MTIEAIVREYIRETVKPLTRKKARIKSLQGGWSVHDRRCSLSESASAGQEQGARAAEAGEPGNSYGSFI